MANETSAAIAADLCRVTLVAPRVRLDVALPVTLPLAALLPALLAHAGEGTAEDGALHGGWVLQKVGESALDTERTVAGLGIREGEVLHLRPRQDALPAVVLDDPVDAIGTALRDGSRRWTTADTGVAAAVAAGLLLLAAAALPLAGRPPWHASVRLAELLASVLVVASGLVARGYQPAAGRPLALAGVASAFVTGLLLLAGDRSVSQLGAAQLLVGAAAAVLAAALAMVATGRPETALLGVVAGAVLGAAGLLAALPAGAVAGAGVAVTLPLAVTPLLPRLAYLVAGLPRPALAVTAEALREHGTPLDAADVTRRSLAADRVLTALAAATGAVAGGATVVMLLVAGPGNRWVVLTLAASAAVLLLLRARLFAGLVQRLWLLGGGLAGTVALGWRSATWYGPAGLRLSALALVLAGAAGLCWVVRPGRRVSAPWARASDLAELVVTLGLVPLALQLLGGYAWLRSWNG